MISKALSKEAKEDFDIVVMVAQNIGLADNPPVQKIQEHREINSATTNKRKRRCNHSDLVPLQRSVRAKEIKQRSVLQRASASAELEKKARKGSIKDVFVDRVKAYQNPQLYIKTQKAILRNDYLRTKRYANDAKKVIKMSENKHERLNILGDISAGIPVPKIISKPSHNFQNIFLGERRNGHNPSRTLSFQKLAISLDGSKFKLIPRLGGVSLLVHEKSDDRQVQTARSVRRRIDVRFNSCNKVELFYPNEQSQSELF